jgi:hypothetical protein
MDTTSNRTSRNLFLALLFPVALLLIGAASVVTPLILRYIAWQKFNAETERIEIILEGWRAPPAHANPVDWEAAWGTLYNALGNVCFTPEHISARELARLREDVERKNQEPVTFETLEWLWWRLGQTGPHGNEYITQMQPMWEERKERYVESVNDQPLRPAQVPR